MSAQIPPPPIGSKRRILYDLFYRENGATLTELNRATGWNAWSYKNDVLGIAEKYGGTAHWTGGAGTRRFWITRDETD